MGMLALFVVESAVFVLLQLLLAQSATGLSKGDHRVARLSCGALPAHCSH